ncbi:hypothetical protein BDW68DRAFT_183844 [Aspergillus falconensis]
MSKTVPLRSGYFVWKYVLSIHDRLVFRQHGVFLLLGPVLFAASVYMVLARLIRSTFVTDDIISFLVHGTGAGMMAMDEMAVMAKGIVIGGLMVQIGVFGFFIVTLIVFEKRMKRAQTSEDTRLEEASVSALCG